VLWRCRSCIGPCAASGLTVTEDYLPIEGIVVPLGSLSLPRAKALAELASSGRLPYVKLVECFTRGQADTLSEAVVIDVVVERPQRPVHDIRHQERIAVVFDGV